jgi:hypothetical protein
MARSGQRSPDVPRPGSKATRALGRRQREGRGAWAPGAALRPPWERGLSDMGRDARYRTGLRAQRLTYHELRRVKTGETGIGLTVSHDMSAVSATVEPMRVARMPDFGDPWSSSGRHSRPGGSHALAAVTPGGLGRGMRRAL